eukprot:15048217-Alexandrium_andersonii.AAC.1
MPLQCPHGASAVRTFTVVHHAECNCRRVQHVHALLCATMHLHGCAAMHAHAVMLCAGASIASHPR